MSFSVTFFGPKHHWWKTFSTVDKYMGYKPKRVWFYRPDEHSTGGVGFCIPGLHVVFCWGRK